ncbi:hypothetical protein BC941DRAFT_411212 [Chlamydoabsidia padenii]|nr:hypothetical protein BC941DRAFT_411212 [Chlamydoabsidia padenii]
MLQNVQPILRPLSRRSAIGPHSFPQHARFQHLLSSSTLQQRQKPHVFFLLSHYLQRKHYSAAAISRNEKARSNLNLIDFFDPDLATSTPHNYTLKYGVSGHAKAGKVVATDDDSDQDAGIYTSIQVGDDAYFVRNDSLGVSDGVGGKMKDIKQLMEGVLTCFFF